MKARQFSLEDLCNSLVVTDEMLETIKNTEGFKIVFENKKTNIEYEYEIGSFSVYFEALLNYTKKVLLSDRKQLSKELKSRL